MRDYDFADSRDGRREIDPRSFSHAVIDTLCAVAEKLKNDGLSAVRSITVASLGEAVVPLDQSGEPLCNFITGTDRRGEGEALDLWRHHDAHRNVPPQRACRHQGFCQTAPEDDDPRRRGGTGKWIET